jgi:MazG family protein
MSSAPGQHFVELLSVMARLRGEGGCPWDREQTPESLRPCLLEEAYEVLEAIDRKAPGALREELGDLLLQVVFHARIAEERGDFTMADVLATLVAKLRRRHPHVFGDARVESAAAALQQWEAIKRAEPGQAPSALDGVPRALPALQRAQRVQRGAARVGFDWTSPAAALDKVREETAEVEAALAAGDPRAVAAELGDLLFAAVNVARLAGADAETALGDATGRFAERFRHMESEAGQGGRDLASLSPEEQDRLWETAKARRPER